MLNGLSMFTSSQYREMRGHQHHLKVKYNEGLKEEMVVEMARENECEVKLISLAR